MRPHQYQRGVGDAIVGDGVAVHQQLPVRKRLYALQSATLKPALAEIRDGVFVQIGQRRAWTDVGGEVVPSFLVDSPSDLVNRHEAVAYPPPRDAVLRVLYDLTNWTRRHDEHQYTMTCIVGQLREIDIDVQAVNQPFARPFRLLEGLAAHDLARSLVRYPEHAATAAIIGHGTGVLGEIVKLVGVLRLPKFN